MKNFFAVILLLCASACVNAPSGHGFLYTEVQELIYYDPYIKPQQRATLCSHNVLGLFSYGDAGLAALKLESNIRKISTIERTYSSRFIFYGESCLIIKGE